MPLCLLLFQECYVLIFWKDEDTVSVVKESDIIGAVPGIGEVCEVKGYRNKTYSGQVAAIGMIKMNGDN